MLNRDVFIQDPTTFTIPNDGVTVVTDPQTDQEWDVLRYELRSFVCNGEYREGMERVLSTFLGNQDKPKQPAVWVSGFYGSGKSHFVRVLQHLWNDVSFPNGASARGLVNVPAEIDALLRELTTAGKREGGLWAAAGKLGAGAGNVQLAVLRILFHSAGLPTSYAPASLAIWLKEKELYDNVKAGVEARGADFESELHNLYVSLELAESLIETYPGWAKDADDVSERLLQQFPDKDSVNNDELVYTMEHVLRLQSDTPGKLPLTLLVFDELQQSIDNQSDVALQVQEMVEACSTRFGSRVLFVGTGQAALEATPHLSKLQDRFTVRVSLEDKDVEQVVREVVLRKKQDKVPALQDVLDLASGEIDRHLQGTKIAPTGADVPDFVPDYPLLPTRRRFWERVLRAIDRAGTAAQLRTQLRVVQEATKQVAERSLGTVVGGDMIYDQQKSAMLQSGVLLREVHNTIEDLQDGTPEGELRSRLCALIFLINELPAEGVAATGVRARPGVLADLLVEDLQIGSASLRHSIPGLLSSLVEDGTLMKVDQEYRLQTRESAEWQRDFRGRRNRILADDARLVGDRTTAFRTAVESQLKSLRIVQGITKTHRKHALHLGHELPPIDTGIVPVWIRDGWTETEKSIVAEAQSVGTNSPIVFVLLPRQDADALKQALASDAAATETLAARSTIQNTPEGAEARKAMETGRNVEAGKVSALVEGILANARVYQGGGNELSGATLQDSVEMAVSAAVDRLFPRFVMVDEAGWGKVVKRAGQGADDALSALGFTGSADQHPACKEIQSYIGAKRQGKEIRNHFGGVDYGWPQDAIDGALLALVAEGYVRAEKNGQPLTVRQIPQNQIGVVVYHNETQIVTTIQRIQVRSLIQDVGLPVKSGEELEAIPRLLQRLQDLAEDAGGASPLPERPSTALLEDLQSRGGNDQLIAVYDKRTELRSKHQSWSEAKTIQLERVPNWSKLQRLLQHAADLPIHAKVAPQVEAILKNRSLLNDPDPVSPLTDELTTALRTSLQAARQRVVDARTIELQSISSTEEWTRLEDEEWDEIFTGNQVGLIDELDIGTNEKLLAALDAKPLNTWQTEKEAIPARMRRARDQAARQLEPAAVRIIPKSTTLHSVEEADIYLDDLRNEIIGHITDGMPVLM